MPTTGSPTYPVTRPGYKRLPRRPHPLFTPSPTRSFSPPPMMAFYGAGSSSGSGGGGSWPSSLGTPETEELQLFGLLVPPG